MLERTSVSVLEPELKARKIDIAPCVQVTQRRSPFILFSLFRKESRLGVVIELAYDSLKKDNRDLGAEAPSVRFLFFFESLNGLVSYYARIA